MLKKFIAAAALAFGLLAAGAAGPALAGTNVDIGIGLGRGYGDPGPSARYLPAGGRISCREGASIVHSAGFKRVQPMDCSGSEYTYRGVRHDNLYKITIKSRNGQIRRADRIRRGGGGWGGGYDDGDDYDDGGGYDDGGYDDGDY